MPWQNLIIGGTKVFNYSAVLANFIKTSTIYICTLCMNRFSGTQDENHCPKIVTSQSVTVVVIFTFITSNYHELVTQGI